MIGIVPNAVYTSYYMLSGADLYSGGENDPIIDATVHAMDHLAFDRKGNKLPFSISCSIFAQQIDMDIEMLEDKEKTYRRWDQRIGIHVIVFNTMDEKVMYDLHDNVLIE